MTLGHEKLDVYRLSIGYVAWVYGKAASLRGIHRNAREQWLRASQSIPLNIAEGNGKTAEADRRRYFEIARGSALECAAIQDVLIVGKALDAKKAESVRLNWIALLQCSVAWVEEAISSKKTSSLTDTQNSIPIPIAISIRYSPNCISLDPNFGALSSN